MFSIDQNCHSLWDALPKLQALSRKGHRVTQFVEDVDVAFTSLGSEVAGGELRLAKERFHRSGGQDWGAALFYSALLGKLPVEIRDWEPMTGMKTKVLAKQLGRDLDDLYDEFSPGDNWQLIGPSYVGDRQHHRVVGDLTVAETAAFLRQIMDIARQDMLGAFPEPGPQQRLREWFDGEQQRLQRLIDRCQGGRLVQLYQLWMREYLPETVALDVTSSLLALPGRPGRLALLETFTSKYDLASRLYNEAVEETGVGLRPLKISEGELPFFAVLQHQGHRVRTPVWLADNAVQIADGSFPLAAAGRLPLEAMAQAGIRCLAGKAILLVVQARHGPDGEPLAMPYRGSAYMPAAHRLVQKLSAHGLLEGPLRPIVRVRFHLLDRLGSLKTLIHLPDHLGPYLGREVIRADELAEAWPQLAADAAQRLEAFKDPSARQQWQRQSFAELFEKMAELDRRRREVAQVDPKSPEIRGVWKQIKSLQVKLLDRTVRQIARDAQASRIDYWDSRGALLPWSMALGGEGFYDELVAKADVYEEPAT